MNKIIFIASVLNPRNKFVYVSFALEELLGEETGNVVNTKVEAYLRDLFAIYVSMEKVQKVNHLHLTHLILLLVVLLKMCPKIL